MEFLAPGFDLAQPWLSPGAGIRSGPAEGSSTFQVNHSLDRVGERSLWGAGEGMPLGPRADGALVSSQTPLLLPQDDVTCLVVRRNHDGHADAEHRRLPRRAASESLVLRPRGAGACLARASQFKHVVLCGCSEIMPSQSFLIISSSGTEVGSSPRFACWWELVLLFLKLRRFCGAQ